MIKETHVATVFSNEDPEKRGRIKVTCVGLVGNEDEAFPHWVDPSFEWGWFIVPDVGELVDIEVLVSTNEDESPNQSFINQPNAHWKKRHYTEEETEGQTESRPIPEDFTSTNYGKRRGFATPAGHVFMFDDSEGSEEIRISRKKDDNYSYVSMDKEGSMIIANDNGSYIYLDSENGAVSVVDEHGNIIQMNETELSLIDKTSNIITMKEGLVQVLGQDAIVLSSKTLNIKSVTIDLGDGADAFVVRGTELLTWLTTHIHPFVGLAPGVPGTTAPSVTPVPATLLSATCKVK